MSRPRTVYRGKRRYRWVVSLALMLVLLLLAGAAWLYVYMQRYIVFDGDELRLVPPFLAEERGVSAPAQAEDEGESVAFTPLESVEIVVAEPDFSDLDLVDESAIGSLRARYVAAENVSAEKLGYYGFSLTEEQNALVLQLKTADGYFSYRSALSLPSSYGVNGEAEIREAVAALKESGVYLVAEIGTLVDEAMAVRNAPLALKNAAGAVFSDSAGSYLDPYNKDARAYIAALLAEIADMGFDEVLLSGLAHPASENIVFSQDMTAAPSVSGSVATFAARMSEEARALGLACSARVDETRLRAGTSGEIGQDLELFFRVFDRVYVSTDAYYLSSDLETLSAALGHEAAGRIVPIVSYTPDTDSWAIS